MLLGSISMVEETIIEGLERIEIEEGCEVLVFWLGSASPQTGVVAF